MEMSEHATWTGSPEGEFLNQFLAVMMSESERLMLSSRLGLSRPQILNVRCDPDFPTVQSLQYLSFLPAIFRGLRQELRRPLR